MWRFSERNVQQKWACPMSENPALFREHMDKSLRMCYLKCGSYRQKCNCIHYSASQWSTSAIFGIEELCLILSVPYMEVGVANREVIQLHSGNLSIFEFAIYGLGVIGKNVFSQVIAPPAGSYMQFIVFEIFAGVWTNPPNCTTLSCTVLPAAPLLAREKQK